jgi:CRP/FNR family cyclic AMP-dependent transcriptional regulator
MIAAMGKQEIVSSLRRVSLFAGLSDKDLGRLATSLIERTFEAGHEIAVEGRDGVGMFVIESGEATVSQGGDEIGKLGPGDHFGEMALIDHGPRSATVVADTELRCRGMTAWLFRPFVEAHSDVAWSLLETLVARLREAEGRGARS